MIKNLFKGDILKYKPKYMKKIIELINPVLKSLLHSSDSSERAGGLLIAAAMSGLMI